MYERVARKRDDIPEAIILETGAIRFRHYLISVHAIDRFMQRTNGGLTDLMEALHDSVLALPERSRHYGIQRAFERNDSAGGYTLKYKSVFFFIQIDPDRGYHVVATIMTKWNMTRGYNQKRGCTMHREVISSFCQQPLERSSDETLPSHFNC